MMRQRNGLLSRVDDRTTEGFFLGLGLNVLLVLLAVSLGISLTSLGIRNAGPIFSGTALTVGVAQFIYMVPLFLDCRKHERKKLAKGLAFAAGLTLLLNLALLDYINGS